MSHIQVRMYTGRDDRSTDEALQAAAQQLAPLVQKAGGLERYTLVKFSDGRIGSVSLYDDKASADRGLQVAAEWVRGAPALQGYQLSRTLAGERVFAFNQGNQTLDNTYGVMRIYRSAAAANDVKAALEQEARPILQRASGLLRYSCFKLDDGYAILTAHQTKDSAQQLTQQAREARRKSGSHLQQVLPQDPEIIEGEIVRSFGK